MSIDAVHMPIAGIVRVLLRQRAFAALDAVAKLQADYRTGAADRETMRRRQGTRRIRRCLAA
jgi:hypothetical protein